MEEDSVFLLQSVIYKHCWGLCSPKRILTQKGFRFRPDAFTQLYIDSIYAERCTERQIKIYFFSFSNREFLENLRHSPNLFFYKSAFVAPNWDRSAVEVIFWLERKTKLGHRWRNGGVDLCRKFLAAVCQPLANFYSSVTDLWWRNSISANINFMYSEIYVWKYPRNT